MLTSTCSHLRHVACRYVALIADFRSMASQPTIFVAAPPPVTTDGAFDIQQSVVNSTLPRAVATVGARAASHARSH